jgi:hypothetical protein
MYRPGDADDANAAAERERMSDGEKTEKEDQKGREKILPSARARLRCKGENGRLSRGGRTRRGRRGRPEKHNTTGCAGPTEEKHQVPRVMEGFVHSLPPERSTLEAIDPIEAPAAQAC